MDPSEVTAAVIKHISIPISALGDDLNCPICWNVIQPAMITYCGHRFCETCIKTSVSTWKKCPVCNEKLTVEQLIQDKGFNNLVQIIETQKKKAADIYFRQVADKVERDLVQEDCVAIPNAAIQPVLQKHLKKTLLEFELYSQKIQRDITEEVMSALASESGAGAMQSPSDMLQSRLSSVVDAYDRYLSENLPPLTLLPVTVDVRLHGKEAQVPSFTFKPSTSIESLYLTVLQHFSAGPDLLVEFEREALSFILVRPSAIGQVILTPDLVDSIFVQQLSTDYVVSTAPLVVMSEKSFPLLTYQVTPGSEVIIYGKMKFASELPKSCFIKTFKKGAGMVMDYFACSDCSLKWICRPCKESCHKDHKLTPHVMKHTPGWACCYCKKKQCTLLEQ